MVTKQPRLNVVLEPSVYKAVQKMSKREGLSMSLLARDLIREALSANEDFYWTREVEDRLSSFSMQKSLSHEQVWGA